MKRGISVRKIFQIIFCIMALVGAVGLLPTTFTDSLYSGIATVVIAIINLVLIAIAILKLGNSLYKILFSLDFIAFVIMSFFSQSMNPENIFTVLLVNGGFYSWLIYVGLKYFLSLFLIPFKILGFIFFRKKGEKKKLFSGTKWVCTNCSDHSNIYCGQTTITFRNGHPASSFLDGCDFSDDGKHNFEPVGEGSDVNISIIHLAENLGMWLGVLAGLAAFITKIIN